ncbi:hypothetical protein [Accumulibacter sp.]|jgi:hypothetical protein|uniref:hypothetical protein n=1 Tax=Accumulibacter sp. TaxID=2053492 RepID=UPI001AD255F1|nr:hypothetical protein [Accumulibacter sp.]MBN8452227.1 hypothetical protein [Accumulibacter sp.]
MSEVTTGDSLRSERLAEYVARFSSAPPLLYMQHLSDEEFAVRISAAIDSGAAISDEEFDGEASERTTVY